jgi:transcriptional regulator
MRIQIDASFVARVNELRGRGLKQEDIAVELGVVQATISRILREGLRERRPRGKRPSRL